MITNIDRIVLYLLEAVEGDDFCIRLVFSDGITFNLNGQLNRHNVRISDLTNPYSWIEHEWDSPKGIDFCVMSVQKIYGLFFSAGKIVTGYTYFDMLQIWLFPQIKEDLSNLTFQQDGAPPHWATEVCSFLNTELPRNVDQWQWAR